METSASQDVDLSQLPEPLRQAIQARMELERQQCLQEKSEREKVQQILDQQEAIKNQQETRSVLVGAAKIAIGVGVAEAVVKESAIAGVFVEYIEHLAQRIHDRRLDHNVVTGAMVNLPGKTGSKS